MIACFLGKFKLDFVQYIFLYIILFIIVSTVQSLIGKCYWKIVITSPLKYLFGIFYIVFQLLEEIWSKERITRILEKRRQVSCMTPEGLNNVTKKSTTKPFKQLLLFFCIWLGSRDTICDTYLLILISVVIMNKFSINIY